MKVEQTVKTKEHAKKIISDEFKAITDQYKYAIWNNSSCQCECGETSLISYHACNDNGDAIFYAIGVCGFCGVDDPLASVALYVKISSI